MEYGRMLADPYVKRRFNVLIMCIGHWVCGQKEERTEDSRGVFSPSGNRSGGLSWGFLKLLQPLIQGASSAGCWESLITVSSKPAEEVLLAGPVPGENLSVSPGLCCVQI